MYIRSLDNGPTNMYELIEKYLTGRCTPAEEARLSHLFKEYGYSLDNEDIDKLLEEIPPAQYPDKNTSDKMHRFILDNISAPVKKIRWVWLSAAASILIAGSFLFYQHALRKLEGTAMQWVTQSNPGRGITQILMPDSTLIWLNASSSVQYPKDYLHHRALRLTGEAFFKVRHNVNKPFSVQSHNLKVIVLGTSFNVKDYPNERHSEVQVSTGKVNASVKGKDSQFLLPGEVYNYDRKSGEISKGQTKVKDIDAWTTGLFVFNDMSLEEITNILSRSYGVKFTFQTESLKHRKITLRLRNESLNTIMKVLQISAGIHYRQSAHQVWLSDAK